MNRRDPAFVLALLVALAAYALLAWRYFWLCDDAFIAFRYGQNLAEGHGLRFNLDENPPVEGYTQFLWVLWCGLLEKVGLDVTRAAPLSSFACGFALVAMTMSVARRRLALGPVATACCGLFLALLPPIAVWATGGLETMPFATALFWLYSALLGEPGRPRLAHASVAAAIAALLRADAPVFVGAVLLAAAWTRVVAKDARALRAAVVVGLVFAAVTAAHVAWRYGYHGDLVPNTAHVKAGFALQRLERGAYYVISLLLAVPSIPLALLLAYSAWPKGLPSSGALRAQATTVLAIAAAYAVYVGGDFMAFGRFLVPALPFVALLFAGFLAVLRPPFAAAVTAPVLALSLLPAFDVNPVPKSVRDRFDFRWSAELQKSEHARWEGMRDKALVWADLGRALALHTQPGESLIRTSIGAVGYYCDLKLLDRYGLIDRDIAQRPPPLERATPGHDRLVEPGYFLEDDPTYVFADLVRANDAADVERALALVRAELRGVPIEHEVIPLPVEDGFDGRASLLLVRRKEGT